MLNEQEIKEVAFKVRTSGYDVIENLYPVEAIRKAQQQFTELFRKRYRQGKVQSRDYRRFTCKLPVNEDYIDLLKNDAIHQVLLEILGEDYVLYNFNSHSSLPGSSKQVMHFDSVDPQNSDTYISNQTKVVFLHIPLLDTEVEHGPTEVWPAVIHKQDKTLIQEYDWISKNLPVSSAKLKQGDVIIRRDNCVHAGGKNASKDERHFITLVFTSKDYYLNYNSGMIPGAVHPELGLPYRIASHCPRPPKDLQETYAPLDWIKPSSKVSASPFSMKYLQYEKIEDVVSEEFIEQLLKADLDNANIAFNLVNCFLPLARAAFGKNAYFIHSIKRKSLSSEWSFDEPGFSSGGSLINSSSRVLSLKVFLSSSNKVNLVPGDISSCSITKEFETGNNLLQARKELPFAKGDVLVNSGALPYRSLEPDTEVLEILFIREDFDMKPEERIWISDTFALSLPKALAKVIRYNNVFITQEKYQDFQFRRLNYLYYSVFNYIELYQKTHPVQGNLLKLAVGIFFIPVMIHFALEKPVSKMLGTS